jgi:hypothetical protein
MNKEIYVEDPRPNNDSSIGLVPHLNTYADIITHFGSLTIDQSQAGMSPRLAKAVGK